MKYTVSGLVTVSCWTEVDANSEEEAIKIAGKRELAHFSIYGSSDVAECFHIENDGTPSRLMAEKED